MTDQEAYSVISDLQSSHDWEFEQNVAMEVALDALLERMGQTCVDETPA